MDQNFYSVKWMSDSISQKIKDKFLKKMWKVISATPVKESVTKFLKQRLFVKKNI